mgnify:CR=1 FL=1
MRISAIPLFGYQARREYCVGEPLLLWHDALPRSQGRGDRSLSSLLRRGVSMGEVKKKTIGSFESVFALKTEQISLADLLASLSSADPSHRPAEGGVSPKKDLDT